MSKILKWKELTDLVREEYCRLMDAIYPMLESWQSLKYMVGEGLTLFDEDDDWAVIEVVEVEPGIEGTTMIYRIRSEAFGNVDKLMLPNPDDAVVLLESILSQTTNMLTPQNRVRAEKLIPVLSRLNPSVRWSLSTENVVMGNNTAVCTITDLTQNTAAVKTMLKEEKWFLLGAWEGCVEEVASKIVAEWGKWEKTLFGW